MGFWIVLWKAVFITTIAAYSVMAVWVTVQGARDIKAMLSTIRSRHEDDEESGPNAAEEEQS